jgi:hypothetical protein
MSRYIPYSKRLKQATDVDKPLIYQYDKVPGKLRNQVILILREALGQRLQTSFAGMEPPTAAMNLWSKIFLMLREELGVFALSESGRLPDEQVCNFLLNASCEEFLDCVELSLTTINVMARGLDGYEQQQAQISTSADSAIDRVNYRFQENCFGYAFVTEINSIVRINSQHLHKQVVEQAFSLLQDARFKGPEDEFADAFRDFREGRNKDAITKALNAFESTIKTICVLNGWSYDQKATASGLIATMFEHELLSKRYEGFFGALKAVLESGLPAVRNASAASHGQGPDVVPVPTHVTAFALHLAASSIVLLVEANKAYTKNRRP